MGELEMKKEFVAAPPQNPQSALLRQPDYKSMIQKLQSNLFKKLQIRKTRLQTAINAFTSDSNCAYLEDNMFDIDNEIMEVKYDTNIDVKVPLTKKEKGEWKTNKKAYGERVQKHLLNQQTAFAIILGQCTQRLQDKMHNDAKLKDVNKKTIGAIRTH
jgi:hypothetical protein